MFPDFSETTYNIFLWLVLNSLDPRILIGLNFLLSSCFFLLYDSTFIACYAVFQAFLSQILRRGHLVISKKLMVRMRTCNKMLLSYLLPFHPDFMYIRRETQKPHFVVQLEKEFNTRNWMHPKLIEEPGECREGR